MKQLKETFIGKKEVSDLDLMEPFWEDGADEPNEIEWMDDIWNEAPSMDIDQLMEILEKYKKEGANRVYIAEHSDHQGYEFNFVKLEEL